MSREPDIVIPTSEGAIVGRIPSLRGKEDVEAVIDQLVPKAPRRPRRKVMGPLEGTKWHTGIAYAYGFIDEQVAQQLERIPRNPSGEHSGMAEYAALARVAEHHVCEYVAYARRNGRIYRYKDDVGSWEWIADRLGCTPREAARRYEKLPEPPLTRPEHAADCSASREHLRMDRKGWGCPCGATGKLDWTP